MIKDFRYDNMANDELRINDNMSWSASVFTDRPLLLNRLSDDAIDAGLIIARQASLGELANSDIASLGDVIIIDCPNPNAKMMSTLAKIDAHAVQRATQIIVSTSVEGLDAVFGCIESPHVQILVDPTSGEWAIALGIVLSTLHGDRFHELGDSDRLLLVRLTEQVNRLAERMEQIGSRGAGIGQDGSVFRFRSPATAFDNELVNSPALFVKDLVAASLEPAFIKQIIRNRRLRNDFFEGEIFADPAWDMLLDLSVAALEGAKVSISSLCIAAAVPATTALRWIGLMVESGLFERKEDKDDKRRVFIELSHKSERAMAEYFAQIAATGTTVMV